MPGRSGHFGSLRTRAALNSPGGGGGEGERLLLTWRYSIAAPFVSSILPRLSPVSSTTIVSGDRSDGGLMLNEIREGKGLEGYNIRVYNFLEQRFHWI